MLARIKKPQGSIAVELTFRRTAEARELYEEIRDLCRKAGYDQSFARSSTRFIMLLDALEKAGE